MKTSKLFCDLTVYRLTVCFILLTLFCVSLSGQNLSELSDEGYAHWVTAERLLETADDMNEYSLIAEELEAVINTDPRFKDSYMKLVVLYEKMAIEGGEPVFVKAEQLLETFLVAFPEEERVVKAEMTYIEALREKYRIDVPMRFVGKWDNGLEIACQNGYFTATLSPGHYDPKYEREVISLRQEGDHLILKIKQTYDGIASGRLKYDKVFKKYIEHLHKCDGKEYLWTKEVEIHTYKLYEDDGKLYIANVGRHTTLYSQYGVKVHTCSKNFDPPLFKTELKRY